MKASPWDNGSKEPCPRTQRCFAEAGVGETSFLIKSFSPDFSVWVLNNVTLQRNAYPRLFLRHPDPFLLAMRMSLEFSQRLFLMLLVKCVWVSSSRLKSKESDIGTKWAGQDRLIWCCLCALHHGIQNSLDAILACHPALCTEWLAEWHAHFGVNSDKTRQASFHQLQCEPVNCEPWHVLCLNHR